MNTPTLETTQNNQETIASVAKSLWEEGGRQSSHDLDYWLEAEKKVLAQRKSVAADTNSAMSKPPPAVSNPVTNTASARAVAPKPSRRLRVSQLANQRRAPVL
ncbi:MAG: DUF2934 domain-containing protein [Verrucomicrobia bacterium]|nr:DUF2934 domain-containing protein [Verrucomicrobiota bacterium]